jgi:hypothetical protein
MKTLTTSIFNYQFNVATARGKKEYDKLATGLKKTNGDCLRMITEGYNSLMFGLIELSTEHLFHNQWNATNGQRVFDWFEEVCQNENIRKGHYLVITDEMKAIRNNTCVCGYCGQQVPLEKVHESGFCLFCLSDPYLTTADIHLTRMLKVSESFSVERKQLEPEEIAFLAPLYSKAQSDRLIKETETQRLDLVRIRDKKIKDLEDECAGKLWILDHGMSTDNVIYYECTSRFSFGYRYPVTKKVRDSLAKRLENFPYNFDIQFVGE